MLGLGYSMGAERFASTQTKGSTGRPCRGRPEQIVEAWRDAAPRIAGARPEGFNYRCGGLWQKLNIAAKQAVRRGQGAAHTVGALTFRRAGGDLLCVLPSGRFLRYREARLERAKNESYEMVGFRQRKQRRPGYGGLWTENAVQAIARDIIAAALVRLEAAGLAVVMHVHDEVVCELAAADADQGVRRMVVLCEELPAWATGLPLKAEGFWSQRYRKG